MTTSTHAYSDANAKKIARAMFWSTERSGFEKWKDHHISDVKVAVLSGPYGYDARVATAYGFRHIWCIDRNESNLQQAQESAKNWNNPIDEIKWVHRDFFDVISEEDFELVFFDGYGHVLDSANKLFGAMSDHVARGDGKTRSVGIGGSYGRDGFTGGPGARIAEINRLMIKRASELGIISKPNGGISYSSRRHKEDGSINPGTPMLYVTSSVGRLAANDRRSRRAAKRHGRRRLRQGPGQHLALGSDLSGDELRRTVVMNRQLITSLNGKGSQSKLMAEVFCVPWQNVAAWLAADTQEKKASDATA